MQTNVLFPLAGRDIRMGFQNPADGYYTSVSTQNCMPIDSIAYRLRGGSRHGVSKALAAQVDTTPGPVLALAPIWNAAATVQYMMAVIDDNSPVVRRLASGAWASATDSTTGGAFNAETTESKRIVVFPSTTAGRLIMCSAGWGKTYEYRADGNTVNDHTSNAAVSGMQWVEKLWLIVAPRTIKNTTDSLDYTLKTPGNVTANDPLTACTTWGGTYGVFWTKSTTTVIAGNPVTGNPFRTISYRYGCLDAQSFCAVPNGPIYFMSSQGLCELSSPDMGGIKVVSNDRMPPEMLNIDPASYHVVMAYDSRQRGIHIFISKISAVANVAHWFYKIAEPGCPAGFWGQIFHTDVEPFSICSISESASGLDASAYTDLVWGGRSGYLYRFDPTVITDDGNSVSSAIWIGPMYGMNPSREGRISAVRTTLGSSSGSVTMKIRRGDSAQEAFAASAFSTRTLAAGTNKIWRPSCRAYSWFLTLESTARWAFENCVVERADAGSVF